MNISIRDYIKNNFKNTNENEIEETINSSLQEQTEETLPGLGVFFETLWQNSSKKQQTQIIRNLTKSLS